MKTIRIETLVALGCLGSALTLRAGDLPTLSTGHTDVGVNYEDGTWDLHVHAEDLEMEYEPDAVWLKVGGGARTVVPSAAAFSFLGATGDPIWILPAIEKAGLLFLGLGTEEMASGLFSNNVVRLALKSVEGPGDFIVYQLDAFGTPIVAFNSRDGIATNDVRTLAAGGHTHVNWAFTAPGNYRIGLQASGVLAATGQTTTSDVAQYLFDVGEQPCHTFTSEHLDLLSVRWNSVGNTLSLMASDDEHGALYASNQCVVLCPESMKFTLPGGTPLGTEGDPLWILPQNPYPDVPYVGASAESIAAGVFNDPFTIRLARLEGPGQFLLWQAGTFGDFDVLMDTRDGINAADALTLSVGGHAHYNWGFTTNGVYRAYFQVSAVRVGQTTNTVSPETPFTVHVLPLRPYETWTATNWPCACASNLIAAASDPDHDGIINLLEYAFGNDPNVRLRTNAPAVAFVNDAGTNYGAIRYVQATNATDLTFEVLASSSAGAFSETLTNASRATTNGPTATVTVRDAISTEQATHRFYQLRVRLNDP